MESRVIELTLAAEKYGNLNIRPCGLDFFPPDAFGGPSKKAGLGNPITLKVEGLPNPIETDIPTDKKTGRPRWFFRERAWVKTFVRTNSLIPGDTVTVRRISNRIYELIPKKRKLKFIDLFCGAGGFSLGFDKAGFKNVFSLDIKEEWCLTYKENFPEHLIVCKDIREIGAKDVKKLCKGNKIDVVIGGPPCQGFSIAGNIGRKFIDDERNHLFKEFARIISIVKPKYFIMENVARLHTHHKGRTRQEIIDRFQELGYEIKVRVLNAADFGIPQLRYRAIFIGSKTGHEIKFPEKSVDKYRTVKESIDDLPSLKPSEKSEIPNHEAMNHTDQMLNKMSYISDGGDREQIPHKLRPKSGDIRKYIKYNSKKPSICVTGDMRKVFHYSQNRALTVRELARLQSFPDEFVFKGSKISQQQQVGNAVPVDLAYALARSILEMDQS